MGEEDDEEDDEDCEEEEEMEGSGEYWETALQNGEEPSLATPSLEGQSEANLPKDVGWDLNCFSLNVF